MKSLPSLAALVFVLMIAGCVVQEDSRPVARQGVLDLSVWNPETHGVVQLDGEWSLYWGQLLTPDDFNRASPPQKTGYFKVPSAWNDSQPAWGNHAGTGYATLHLRVVPGLWPKYLALRIFNIHSACALWLDGRQIVQSGAVGKTVEAEISEPSILVREFQNDGAPIDLVLQVSNFHRRSGGVLSSIRLGSAETLHAEQARKWGIGLFFIGSLFVMGIYHLVLYCFRRKNISPFYFGLYCLLWMGNTMASETSGWATLLFFPKVSIEFTERFNLICFFLSVPIGFRFFRSLYPDEFPIHVRQFCEALAAASIACGLLCSSYTLDSLLPVFYVASILLILYCLFRLYRARARGREGAGFILAGFLLLGLTATNDMLLDLQLIRSLYVIDAGMFLFVLFQAFALSLRFSRAFSTIEQLSDELRENNYALSRMDRLKDEFLANTSHELHTPLSGIIGLSESLLDGVAGTLPSKAVSDLSMVLASARRLAGLVNDILDFSRLKNRDLDLQKTPVDLHTLAEIALAVSRPLAEEKGLRTVNGIHPETPCVNGDEDRLLQIFFNLIGNAIKFTSRGEVVISAEVQEEFVEVTFADTGSGIPPDHIETIFGAFEQVDPSASRVNNGVGLGLAISRHLAQLHGGMLWAESTLGRGSIFHLTLPVCLDGSSALVHQEPATFGPFLPSMTPSPHPASPGPCTGSFRILAVDDDPVNLQVIRNHLELEGMEVTTAANGNDALSFIERGEIFDLVLLDVMMPGMTGFDLCRRLRSQFSVTELPVIMLTARKRISDLTEGLESGANDYLGKPFAREELLARTRAQIKVREAEEEARNKSRLAMLGELAAGIAHEVNTPINTIINSSELILLAGISEEAEHDAVVIRNEGRRIAGIMGGLLSFSRRDKGEKSPCSVGLIVSDTLRLIQAKLRKEQIQVLVNVPDTLPDINANPQQMMQVFLNLINNAAHALHIKFPEARPDKIIRIEGTEVEVENRALVRLTFYDQGNGIPTHLLDKVMTPFFTTKPAGMGTGLGLSITQGIVSDHGGTMRLESVEGAFTKVTVELPAVRTG